MIRPFWPVNAFLKDPQQVALQKPIHWSAQRSAGAGNPSWISSRSLPISVKRSFPQKTDQKNRWLSLT